MTETTRAHQPLDLTIAVLTYRRPDDLEELLPQLVEQCLDPGGTAVAPGVLVVDNDPGASARRIVEEFDLALDPRIDVRYVNETVPGISAARNAALDAAAGSDLLIFIDDDERPSPTWLARLLDTYDRHGADAVVGPVISRYEVEPPRWIVAGRFFERRRLATGTPVDVAATNNLLLDLNRVRELGLRFDLGFGTAGGEDTLFTRELHRRGGTMVWCDEAVVVDVVPASRLTRRWVLLRALSSGNSWSLTSVELATGMLPVTVLRLRLTGQGLLRLAGGIAQFLSGVVTASSRRHARGLRTLARGAGMVLGAVGYRYEEYRR